MRTIRTIRVLFGATILATALAVAVPAPAQAATSPPLGSAVNFAVLGAATVTNTGPTVVTGDLGVSPGTAVVGFPPGAVTGTIHTTDALAAQAQADIGTAITYAAGEPCDTNLSGQDLGGMTLPPAVYCFNSSAQLTGTLTLDAQGNPNAAWVFQIASSLTTGSNAAVVLTGGATPCNNNNITWQVGASATVGTGTAFTGNVLAGTSVTFNAGASGTGGLYAHTGAVTMDANQVSTCAGASGKASPTITTTPSGSVPAGGTISDSAQLTGGATPTGTVAFALFGPGDTTCATPIATRTTPLSGTTAASGPITTGAAGTYNWTAVYSGDARNSAATSPCGSEQVVVTAQTLTGRAYGLTATASLLGLPLLTVPPTPDTGPISTPSSTTTPNPCVATLSGLVTAHALCANVTTTAFPAASTATASVADTTVTITTIPAITLRLVRSTSTTTCTGSTGTTTIDFLQVGNTVVIGHTTQPAPNTTVNLGAVSLILNEQIPFTNPDNGLTVNAIHIKVSTLGLAKVNIVVASAESDINHCP
ncbi:choice-of-anchor P family protein [Amycolatopsis minnesotensis]|uniref:Ig-like domain-containing protein n=1 Tax=Amycolatopsis minnesotensis TaxID=337894 RepID=A0ABN2R9K9_9PSEU